MTTTTFINLGVAGLGLAGHGEAWLGMAGHGAAAHGGARLSKARQGEDLFVYLSRGAAGQGRSRQDQAG